ncbi:formate/nitrite transporter family protein [Erythrobacter sp. SCSIO 43205]|uniref:formate/nitrite transporter family protein n=1 Tax=Erythrobacter sp. SCSIO 43205 TaxID=2779361 RepID=UPI001CAA3EA9|nr:formate/nitrite transporter family protein [Erythrobacter sp. SCSIO 43205]UAB78895.1 formate/nitrite transporter family protein [Erythrobacter sp. SCSIO 43205]
MSDKKPDQQASEPGADHAGDAPTSPEIYIEISQEGIEEMERPSASLFWSAIAAGLLVSFSLIVKAALYAETSGLSFGHAIDSLGYTIGFILVIFCRLQLFTENTITPVLPTIAKPTPKNCWNTSRVWGISLVGNFIGTAIMAALFVFTPIVSEATFDAMMSISTKVAELGFLESLVKGMPSGLLIAALVWMRPSSGNSFLGLVFLIIYVIALGDFTHVIVGSCEIFLLAWEGERAIAPMMVNNILPTLIGNVIGGTALFALLAWAQVKDEL